MVASIPTTQIADLCRKHRIRRLSLFGSILREDFNDSSDVDALAEFEPGYSPGWDIIDIEAELGSQFGNRKVDLLNPKYLNRWVRDEILGTAKVIYEAEG